MSLLFIVWFVHIIGRRGTTIAIRTTVWVYSSDYLKISDGTQDTRTSNLGVETIFFKTLGKNKA